MTKLEELNSLLEVNLDWGFHGTMSKNYDFSKADLLKIRKEVIKKLSSFYNISEKIMDKILDFSLGRHFADQLSFYLKNTSPSSKEIFKSVDDFLKKTGNKWKKSFVDASAIATKM